MARMQDQEHDLPFRVEVWDERDSHVDELIALLRRSLRGAGRFQRGG